MVDTFRDGDRMVGKRVDMGDGRTAFIPGAYAMDAAGNATANQTYQLASNATIAATSGTATVTGIQRGTYIFDAQFTGTSVQLQSLGADGVTWRNVGAALTQSGSTSVILGQGSAVRVYNPNGTADTAVYATLT